MMCKWEELTRFFCERNENYLGSKTLLYCKIIIFDWVFGQKTVLYINIQSDFRYIVFVASLCIFECVRRIIIQQKKNSFFHFQEQIVIFFANFVKLV